MNKFLWLVRREFWENRAIWIMPAVIGAIGIFAAMFGKAQFSVVGVQPNYAQFSLFAIGMIFLAAMYIYTYWYLLDCLYTDRKDRSILFFKSMPVGDPLTVWSKIFVGLVAIPIVYFAIGDLTALIMAAFATVRSTLPVGNSLFQPSLWLEQQALWVYVCVAGAIWFLPIAGWLLLVSAWAKRAVILHSILPPLAIILAEGLILGTRTSWDLLRHRLGGLPAAAFRYPTGYGASTGGKVDVWQLMDPAGFLGTPAVWIGAAVGAVFIAGAIQLRMRRADV
jgi:ABC-2 type transport system permease protein